LVKPDPLAALDALTPSGNGGQMHRLDFLLGDQPHQLDRIRANYLRGVSPQQIADFLTANGYKVSGSAVESWLKKEQVRRG
jgi:hypothetical protein